MIVYENEACSPKIIITVHEQILDNFSFAESDDPYSIILLFLRNVPVQLGLV